MALKSFRTDLGPPPSDYRTPSPPLHYIEPFSPGTAAWSDSWSSPFRNSRINKRPADDGRQESKARKSERHSKGVGQGNVMEDFASIALSTNGDQEHQKHFVVHTWDRHQPQFTQLGPSERPSKRARSEKAVSREGHNVDSRPSTSHVPPSDAQRLEAELLLNFSREACVAASKISAQPRSPLLTIGQSQNVQLRHKPISQSRHSLNSASGSYNGEGVTSRAANGAIRTVGYDTEREHRLAESFDPNNPKQSVSKIEVFSPTPQTEDSNKWPERKLDSEEKQEEHIHNGQVAFTAQHLTMPEVLGEEHNTAAIDHQTESKLSSNQSQILRKENHLEQNFPNGEDANEEHSILLSGIEKAAREGTAGPSDRPVKANDNVGGSKHPVAKQKDVDSPSVCAACNFFRNSLTLETENDATSWISCDGCKSWFHFACAGFKSEREVRAVDKFRCRKCKPIHGPTTYVRKSARAHSAIDYAGLNEGIVKTSDENPEHHYIKPIKEGTIKFDQETFARMRPELVTADYFEKGDGMREPIVIPAAFNPRPRQIAHLQDHTDESASMDERTDEAMVIDSSVLDQWISEGFEYEQVPDCGQDALDMVIPLDLTVRKVAELYGPEEKIEVIDVKSQNGEDRKWNMKRWADYYESTGSKVVRNVISLEVSQSKLGALIKRPKVVRDLDLQDSVWPADLMAKGDYPKVQFYCLMSVADCFTDFHIDFGGSSVYYHILKGKKTFFFIPPHEKHLKKYEEWCNSPAQNWTFLGDQTKECYRVDLSEGDTMLIPAGWIHAVWTPEDSLVIGGNFLTRMHYQMQIRVSQIEKATHVARKFRYPHFQKVSWYAALRYLEEDPIPDSVVDMLVSGQQFPREIPTHLDFDGWGERSADGDENYHVRYYPKAELDGLPDLGRYLQRTALIAMGNITEGISVELRNAVRRSIPKGHGEPLDLVKKFAMWYTWKRGNENIPHWAYPDYIPEGGAPELTEKKISTRTLKRLDREAALSAWRVAPDRQSTRSRTQPQSLLAETVTSQSTPSASKKGSPDPSVEINGCLKRKAETSPNGLSPDGLAPSAKKQRTSSATKSSGNRRPACEACRRGRRACKHRDDQPTTPSAMARSHSLLGSTTIVDPPTNHVSRTEEVDAQPIAGITTTQHKHEQSPPKMLRVEIVRPGPIFENSTPEASAGKALGLVEGLTSTQKASGRSKACKDCRKSKRRCVHDEFGNEDPVKLAEAAIPRPAAKKKKVEGEWAQSPTMKKPKKSAGSQSEAIASAAEEDIKAHATVATSTAQDEQLGQLQDILTVTEPVTQPSHMTDTVLANHKDAKEQDGITIAQNFNPEDEVNLISTSPYSELKYEPRFEQADSSPSTSNMKLQITASLVSPPESTHTDAEQSPPSRALSKGVTPPVTLQSSRHSSRPAKTAQRYTPESGTNRRASISSEGQAVGHENGSRATSVVGMGGPDKASKSRMSSEIEADEESLRLIRELQAQDMGLRRRGKVQ